MILLLASTMTIVGCTSTIWLNLTWVGSTSIYATRPFLSRSSECPTCGITAPCAIVRPQLAVNRGAEQCIGTTTVSPVSVVQVAVSQAWLYCMLAEAAFRKSTPRMLGTPSLSMISTVCSYTVSYPGNLNLRSVVPNPIPREPPPAEIDWTREG